MDWRGFGAAAGGDAAEALPRLVNHAKSRKTGRLRRSTVNFTEYMPPNTAACARASHRAGPVSVIAQ